MPKGNLKAKTGKSATQRAQKQKREFKAKTGKTATQRVAKQKREFKKLKREFMPKGNLNKKFKNSQIRLGNLIQG